MTLATLGLYGLITLNIAGRSKEFSIRKVLGAGVKNIAAAIGRQYVILFTIAFSIAAPLSYFLIKLIISWAYSYHMPITFAEVGFAVILLILVLMITISTQIRKVLRSNPVDGLKAE